MDATSESYESWRPEIAIVGELNPDLIAFGLPPDLPEEREILATGFTLTLGSSAAILAHNLSLLGSKVTFTSRIGIDSFGEMCCNWLNDAGVELSHVVRAAGGSNTGITIILPLTTTRRILTYPGTMFEMSIEDLDIDYLSKARHFHLSALYMYPKLSRDIPDLFKEMKRRGLTTSLDPNDDPQDKWEGVLKDVLPHLDLLFCNEREVARIAKAEPAAEIVSAKVPLLVVKRGAHGASAYFEGKRIDVPAIEVDVADAVGAGDSFGAGFLHQWTRQASIERCLKYGNICGALSVTRPGGTLAFLDSLHRESFIRHHWSQEELLQSAAG